MIDDYADYHHAINCAREANKLDLASELESRRDVQAEINGHIAIRLLQTSELEGFSGSLLPGERTGRDPSITDSAPLPPWASSVLGLTRNPEPSEVPMAHRKDFSDILPELPRENASSGALLDYFEYSASHTHHFPQPRASTSSALSSQLSPPMNIVQDRQEEFMCLRLQGRAERKWLKLRGVQDTERDVLIRQRANLRAESQKRFSKMWREKRAEIDKLHRTVRSNERASAQAKPGTAAASVGRQEQRERIRLKTEKQLRVAEATADWLAEMSDELATQKPRLPGVRPRRRRAPKASPEVLELIRRKVQMAYPNTA
ncbi:hypothetical protein PM082_006106 [Marasmius tenuissimus]|nr:hypothetical protein PM082_006106 [Marasmius tenuissimus]